MWEKKGLLFNVKDYKNSFIVSHAAIPYCFHLEGDNFRIYFSSRNNKGQSLPYYINAEIKNKEIKLKSEPVGPLLQLGEPGTFDDNGYST
jgi:hypothetical protein